jgi:hypothetical protein
MLEMRKMNRKDWLKLQIVFEFVFIYIASFSSLFFVILSFENTYKYGHFQFPNPCLYYSGVILFILTALVFENVLKDAEELTILKIKESEKK